MGIGLVKGESSVFVKEETTEGVLVVPTSGSDSIEVMEDGLEINSNRDEIERNILSSTIETEASRLGMKQVSGSIPVEYKAGDSEGEKPKEHVLYKSLLGGFRQISSEITSLTGHTASKIFVSGADALLVKKHDLILIKEAGKYEVRPVKAVDLTVGSESIELLFPLEYGIPSDGVKIAKATTYYHASPAPTCSITHYLGGKIKEEIPGARMISASLENWSTAQVPNWNFSFEALDLDRTVSVPAFEPVQGVALPPVLIKACVWINGVHTQYNELALSLENTKAEILSACSETGKLGSRFTNFKASGSITPYMENDDVDRFNSFNLNEDVSIFGYAYNPTNVAGEFNQIVAFYLPQAKITEMPTGDQDGILTDQIAFKAYRKEGNDTIFLGFI